MPHTADARIEAWAPTREQCVAEAITALVAGFAAVLASFLSLVLPSAGLATGFAAAVLMCFAPLPASFGLSAAYRLAPANPSSSAPTLKM